MTTFAQARIEADAKLPIIRITRDFSATPEELFRAHIDPELFARWVGPTDMRTRIEHWDAKTGGSWRFVQERDGTEYAFHGCFFFNDTATTEIYTLSLHDALPI